MIAGYLKQHRPDYAFVSPLTTSSGDELIYRKGEGWYRLFPFVAGSHSIDVVETPGAPATDGVSFLPTLLGNAKAQKQHAYLYFEYPENSGQLAVRLCNWKGVKTNPEKPGCVPGIV